jgi:hypothetical protein
MSARSPRPLLVLAAALAAAFGLCDVIGLREDVCILSGTMPATTWGAAGGVAYAGLYFAVVVVAPILVLAAPLVWALGLLSPGRVTSAARAAGKKSG